MKQKYQDGLGIGICSAVLYVILALFVEHWLQFGYISIGCFAAGTFVGNFLYHAYLKSCLKSWFGWK